MLVVLSITDYEYNETTILGEESGIVDEGGLQRREARRRNIANKF